ncbi:MAG: PepSY domain-containing protein [Betaproteobacteria bacterium]|nr:PepSY domain-containing protein [Betaproteobacteria bacterium]
MFREKLKSRLAVAHRWIALLLAPVFIVILLSGIVLAFKPVVEDVPFEKQGFSSPGTIVSVLQSADPQQKAEGFSLEPEGGTMTLILPGNRLQSVDMSSKTPVGDAKHDLFSIAKEIHRTLLLNVHLLVEFACCLMLGIVVAGFLLSWPRLSHSPIGWHKGIGWLAAPMILLLPLSGSLMALHIDTVKMPRIPRGEAPLSLVQGIEIAAGSADLSRLVEARRFKRGSVILTLRTESDLERLIVAGNSSIAPAAPGLVKQIHEGTWAGAWSGLVNLIASLGLLGLTGTGLYSWFRRYRLGKRKQSGDIGANILVAYATQTGTAARLAEHTAQWLRGSGQAVCCTALGGMRPEDIRNFEHNLFIVSTTGEGQLPDQMGDFMESLSAADLSGVDFSLLALGDARYKRFCGGGERLRAALLERGAMEISECVRADGDPAPAWQQWSQAVMVRLGLHSAADAAPEGERVLGLELIERTRLDSPEYACSETWSLVFETERVDSDTVFRPGDLLLISPGEGEPERCYSVGTSSLSGGNRIGLTVGRHFWRDENGTMRPGLASDFLCHRLEMGARLSAKLRRHPGFNPPDNHEQPIIMIAAGAGMAPFPGFLAERAHSRKSGESWLIFGNRKRKGDFFYRNEIMGWLRRKTLTRLDLAFSDDPEDSSFVQDRMLENGAELMDWLCRRDAILYTCGRATTIGHSVENALREIILRHGGGATEGLFEQWKKEGRLRFDTFG